MLYGGPRPKGGPQTPGGAFFGAPKPPRKLEKYYFFIEKIYILDKNLRFL